MTQVPSTKFFFLLALGLLSTSIPSAVLQDKDCEQEWRNKTPAMESNTPMSCKNISDGDGYTYQVSTSIPSAVLQDKDCEQEWRNKAGEFLSDGQHHANKTRHPLVLHETRKAITVSECIDLHHSVTCHGSNQKFKHTYQVINDTTLSFEQQPNSTNTIIIWVVVPILIVLLIVGLYYLKKKWWAPRALQEHMKIKFLPPV